ncbi:hypothetical protein SDC9_61523 [bioreactor metagenome]|uniref:WG repeat-containing protein n=1 Tax=bioreactor metagenome TaxID=1076179 RepID=A0A644XGV9_9ZZZZ
MRKIGPFLLAGFFLLLSACGSPGAGNSAAPSEATAAVTGTSSPETAAASESPEPAEDSGNWDSLGVLLPKGPLPVTAYERPSAPARYYADVTQTIIPRNDYGRLWPYIGGHLKQMDFWSDCELYGLCDEKGRVVCDPVFNYVDIIEKDGQRLYKLTKYARDEDYNDASKITLAKLDGSWAAEYDDVITAFRGDEFTEDRTISWSDTVFYDYITVCRNGKWGAIDYGGSEVLPCVYSAPLYFSEGLAAVPSADGTTFRFIDATGTAVPGTFCTPPQQESHIDFGDPLPANYGLFFSEGRARFYENGKYGVIDRDGKVVVPAKYDFISSYWGGAAEFQEGEKYGVLGLDGEVLLEPTDTWFYSAGKGKIVLDLPDGQVLLDLSTGVRSASTGSDEPSWSSSADSGVTIQWADKTLRFPEAINAETLDNGNFALTLREKTWEIVNRKGETVAGPFDGQVSSAWDGYIYVSLGEPYAPEPWEYWTALYDETGKRLLPGEYLSVEPLDDRYLVRTDTSGGLMDKTGGWVIKAPLYDYIND